MDSLEPAEQVGATPTLVYQQRSTRFAALRDLHDRRSRRLANLSLALVCLSLAGVALGLWQASALAFGLALLAALGFVISYTYHARVDRVQRRFAELVAISEEGLLRLRRDWTRLPLRRPAPPDPLPMEAHDLDLLGHASLQHLLNTANMPLGLETLQEWLLSPAPSDLALQRQAAVAELAPLIELRDELNVRGRGARAPSGQGAGDAEQHYRRFLSWAEGSGWLIKQPWLLWLARLLSVATLATLLPQLIALEFHPLWYLLVGANALLSFATGPHAYGLMASLSDRQDSFAIYAALFELFSASQFESPLLRELRGRLTAGGLYADREMARLGRLMAFASLRLSIINLPLQLVALWSVHWLWLMERWQRAAGGHARGWLEALGQLEALAALASLSHDNPGWPFPRFVDQPLLSARQLGHPLILPELRVDNDLSIGPPGSFLLVTGSNMSGKSTLLRSIGLNVVLAQAGGPVVAAALELPPLRLGTSMRVEDSLEQGVSYFMAELRRLKQIVDIAEQIRAQAGPPLLFLLDEILHGTNTGERQIAARQIIRHLLSLGAIGAVSTHDLALADAPELAGASVAVHFRETFLRHEHGPSMRFDYLLRPGIATSTNALKLMELIGLPLPSSEF